MDREGLLKHLKKNSRVLNSGLLEQAFHDVDRKDFVGADYECEAYEDYPLPIGHGQTISQPTTVAFMLELLDPKEGDKVLDVGSGSGWTTALLGRIVGEKGKVVGVERIPKLIALGRENLKKSYSKIIESSKIKGMKTPPVAPVEIRQARKGVIGLPEEGPFDRILVSAAADKLPSDLLDELRAGGTLVIPIGHSIWQVKKLVVGGLETKKYPGFAFVPLVE